MKVLFYFLVFIFLFVDVSGYAQLCFYDAIGTGPLQHTGAISGNGSHGIVAYDFDGDEIMDIATTNSTAHTISILFGNLSGVFDQPIDYPGSGMLSELLLTDLNNDSIPDLIATGGGGLDVFLGTGLGVFGVPNTYGIGGMAYYGVTGDYNEDGFKDVVAANSSGFVSVLLNTGFGTFGFVNTIPTGGTSGITTADFNHDAHLDLVVSDTWGQTVSFLFGTGAGTFSTPLSVTTNYRPMVATASDIDNDGNTDIICTNFLDDFITILFTDSLGSITSQMDWSTSWYEPSFTVVKDINQDGYKDLVFAVYNANGFGYMLNDGSNNFQPPGYYICAVDPVDFVVEDFNNDGLQDVVICSSNDPYFSCMLQCPSTGFAPAPFAEQDYSLEYHSDYIRIVFNAKTDLSTVELFDVAGRRIGIFTASNHSVTLVRKDLPAGVLLFTFQKDEAGIHTGRLIVQ